MSMSEQPALFNREPDGFATYRGDVRHTFSADLPLGPGADGLWRWPVEVGYDPELDNTRVGFTRMPPWVAEPQP